MGASVQSWPSPTATQQIPSPWEIEAEWAKRRLVDFVRQAWPVIEPATEYLHNWHIDLVAEYLEAVTGGEITRLLINMPPRYMKSTAVTVMWPVWEWLRKPGTRWIFLSYSGELATDHSLMRRRIMQSDWFQERWGHLFTMADDQDRKTVYENSERGVMVASGLRGSFFGKGGDRLIFDDPHNPREAQSDVERNNDLTDFRLASGTRLDDKKRGAIVVVMQRLHESDVSQACIEQGYTHLKLPAEAPERTVVSFPRSGREVVRERGDLLWSEREGPKELATAKVALGSYGYAGQYQQEPAPAEGGMLKRHWWRFWHYPGKPLPPVQLRLADGTLHEHPQVELPEKWDQQTQSWDLTFKDTKGSDYVSGGVWGAKGADCFLLDYVLDRMDIIRTIAEIRSMTTQWPDARQKLIEDKANGPAVIDMLGSEVGGLIPVNPKDSKVARVHAVSPLIEAGNVYLPHPRIAPWVNDFIEICAKFPNGAIDDPVDMMTQALLRLSPGSMGVFL